MKLLAIDPGNIHSAYVLYDTEARKPIEWAKMENADLRACLRTIGGDALVVEGIASYGMAVGREVFDTCIAIGRFLERWHGSEGHLLYRREVKLHLCHSAKAKDANVRQALIDRFGPGKDLAIGKKATQGPLYGLTGDCWSALGVAVTAAETAPQTT